MSPRRDNTPAQDRAAPQTGRKVLPRAGVPAPRRSDDELARARLFCIHAGAEIEAIGLDRAVRDLRDADRLVGQLTTIQREAKRARARGIYRSAQDVLSAVQRGGSPDWSRVDARLFVLTRLMEQYESGLDDVESQMDAPVEDLMAEAETATPVEDAHATARQTLTDLLPHASNEERSALERLMDVDLNIVGLEAVPNSDEDPFALAELPDSPVDKLEETAAVEMVLAVDEAALEETVAEEPVSPLASLDTILPDLVQRLLGVAHQFGKIVSVSHAVDAVRVPEDRLPGLQADLYEALSARIASDMPLQGVGHLDINAGHGVLEITGSGIVPFAVSLEAGAGANRETKPAWKPMITDDTEADLRAQLAALLDGGF